MELIKWSLVGSKIKDVLEKGNGEDKNEKKEWYKCWTALCWVGKILTFVECGINRIWRVLLRSSRVTFTQINSTGAKAL